MKKLTTRTLSVLAPLGAALLGSTNAWADDVPKNTFRVGMYAIFYHTKADDISGPFVPPGVNIDLKDTQTLYLGYFRRLSEWFDVELALGVPPKTKTIGRGPATLGSVPYNGQEIVTAKWFAPSALIEYKLLDESHSLRPYVGVGVTFVSFYDRQSTAAGNAATGGPTSIALSNSFGPVGTLGLRYNFSKRWDVIASYSFSRVTSRLTADTAGVIRTTHVNFGPQALVVAAGYSF